MKKTFLVLIVGVLLLTACNSTDQGGDNSNVDFYDALTAEAGKDADDDANVTSADAEATPTDDDNATVATDVPPTETVVLTQDNSPASGKLLYETEFYDLDGWAWFPWWKSDVHSYAGDDFKAKIAKYQADIAQGERFRVQIPKQYTNFAAHLQTDLGSADVRITTDVIITSARPWAYIGTICRYTNDGWYELFVLLDGYWGIMKVTAVDGTYFDVEMLIYEETNAVKVGEHGDIYLFDSTCEGDVLSLTVNGTFLGSVEDNEFKDGGVGLGVAAGEIGNSLIDFENFNVSIP